MPQVQFEARTSEFEWAKTFDALHRATTVIGVKYIYFTIYSARLFDCLLPRSAH
jgi:succinate dehydrogenase/fumarate reductase cytochrome b subunit